MRDPAETGGGGVQTSTTELYRARPQRVKTMLVDVPAAKGLDVYVFAGPTMLDAVERYNLFSGGGALPPLWGLGVQYRGYAKYGADETLSLAARIRAEHIPCDVWGVEPGWQSQVLFLFVHLEHQPVSRSGRLSPPNARLGLPHELLGTRLHSSDLPDLR